jgi:hypothetical protein
VTRAEELVRSTTQTIASTVRDVPPLRLELAPDELRSAGRDLPRPRAGGQSGRWRSWLVPVAAAVAVAAVAVALVIVRNIPNGPVPPRITQANPAATKGVPGYYVAYMQASTPYLVVGDTVTGAQIATVELPKGVVPESVYGTADDDRAFVITSDRARGANAGTQLWKLWITPGDKTHMTHWYLTPLRIPVRQTPAGVALSPDATKLAVALPGTPAVLRIYSMASGALLRTWSAPAGQITAQRVQPGSWQFTGMVLRWSADGGKVAFAWNAATIRALDATAPNGNLLAASTSLAGIATAPTPILSPLTCDATRGWELIDEGTGVVCASSWLPLGGGKCASGHLVTFGFALDGMLMPSLAVTRLASVTECSGQAQPGDGAYLGWAHKDGGILIGSLVRNGHSRFGIFRYDQYTPLPALPISMPLPAGVLVGTDAW